MNNIKQLLATALSKLQFLNKDQTLNMEMLMLWVFLLITAFRALFANATLTIGHDIKWTIVDSNIATTLPMIYSLLGEGHKRYTNSKTQTTDKGDSGGQGQS